MARDKRDKRDRRMLRLLTLNWGCQIVYGPYVLKAFHKLAGAHEPYATQECAERADGEFTKLRRVFSRTLAQAPNERQMNGLCKILRDEWTGSIHGGSLNAMVARGAIQRILTTDGKVRWEVIYDE